MPISKAATPLGLVTSLNFPRAEESGKAYVRCVQKSVRTEATGRLHALHAEGLKTDKLDEAETGKNLTRPECL
jgi:hypothetical protein